MNDTIQYEPFKLRPLSDFRAELNFEFPELPDQLWDYYLVKTAITMAKRGNFVRRRIVLKAQSGVTRYSLRSPDGLDICGILSARIAQCGDCGPVIMRRSFSPPDDAAPCCRDTVWYDPYEDVLHIDGAHYPGLYFITVAVAPKMGACELPEVFYTELLTPLLYGTKGSVLMLSGKSWTNLPLGKSYMEEFMKQIGDAAQDFLTRKHRGIIRMNFGRVR